MLFQQHVLARTPLNLYMLSTWYRFSLQNFSLDNCFSHLMQGFSAVASDSSSSVIANGLILPSAAFPLKMEGTHAPNVKLERLT